MRSFGQRTLALVVVAGSLTFGPRATAIGPYTITVSETSVAEGGILGVSFILSPAPADTVSAQFGTTSFTATGGAAGCNAGEGSACDYITTNGTVTWTPGGPSTQTIGVTTVQDARFEGDEQFFIDTTSTTCAPSPGSNPPCGAAVANSRATQTIADDEGSQTGFTINDVSEAEGNAGNVAFSFTITMNGAAPGCTYGVTFATGGGTATPNNDYLSTSGTFTSFSNGSPTQTATVSVVGDSNAESDETFNVNLTAPTAVGAGCTTPPISRSAGLGTIMNDDGPAATSTPAPTVTPGLQTLNIDDVRAGRSRDCMFNVTRAGGTDGVVSVNYTVTDPKHDVTSAAPQSPLMFAPSEGSKTLALSMAHARKETVHVTLSGAVGATILKGVGDCVSKTAQRR